MKLTDADRERIKHLLREGCTRAEIAAAVGCCKETVGVIKRRSGVVPRAYVRNVHKSMDDPEWRDKCMHARATAHACTADATRHYGVFQVCDEHDRPELNETDRPCAAEEPHDRRAG